MDVQNGRGGVSLVSSGWDSVLFLHMVQVPSLTGELGSHKLQDAPNLPKQRGNSLIKFEESEKANVQGPEEREGDCMVMRY